MYTIFFTINCVEQLTFYKIFVDQLQFEQLIFFLSKNATARNTRTADDFWFSTSFHFFCQLLDLRRAVDIFVRTSFFELSNFEQLIISLFATCYLCHILVKQLFGESALWKTDAKLNIKNNFKNFRFYLDYIFL